MDEITKYQNVLEAWPSYGDRNHGAVARGHVLAMKPASVIDIGCGNNAFVRSIRGDVDRAIGVDLVHPDADLKAWAHEIPQEGKSWDVLTSFDLLEHLAEDELDATLTEWARVSTRYVVAAAHFPHVYRGLTLHRTVKNRVWWSELLEARSVTIGVLPIANRNATYYAGAWSYAPSSTWAVAILKEATGDEVAS